MANRYLQQFTHTFVRKLVIVLGKFTVAGGAVTEFDALGVKSISVTGSTVEIELEDKYSKLVASPGALIAADTVASDGKFSLTYPAALANGTHSFSVYLSNSSVK